MLTDQYAKSIAKAGGIGIADQVYRSLIAHQETHVMSATSTESPIASVGEAEQVIENLNTITDQLVETIEEETARVRAGRLRDAAELGEAKAELSPPLYRRKPCA